MIFVGTEEVHYLKSDLILNIDFVKTKEKRYNPSLLLPERRFTLAQSLLVILLARIRSQTNSIFINSVS